MFITKKHIPRRTFLRGAGVTLALPWLEAMLPARTPLRAQSPPTRFTAIFIPHGVVPGRDAAGAPWWVPDTVGAGFEFPFVLKPLEPLRDRLVILSGLHARAAEPPAGVTGQDHWVAAAFLSATKPKRTTGADITVGTETIDQTIARRIGQDSLVPSLELAMEDPGAFASACGEGYHCSYSTSISWAAHNRPLPMQINPQVVFERLFSRGSTPAERAVRRRQQGSVLDMVNRSLARLRRDVGPRDRTRIDQYAEDIREVERRLKAATHATADMPHMDLPAGVPESFTEHVKLQFDLNALAFQGDITRVSTMQMGRDLSFRSYPDSGTTASFHAASHHSEDPEKIAEYALINRYHHAMVAYFLEKLASIPEGGGTLLDHSLVLYGTNMGDSNQHIHYDVPHVLAGGASGRLRGGRHLAYASRTVPTGNLLLSILDMFGIQQNAIGDSTGQLDGL